MTEHTIRQHQELFKEYADKIKKRLIVLAFIKGAKKGNYGSLIYNLKSQYSRNVNHYPDDLTQASRLLTTHGKKDNNNKEKNNDKRKRKEG